jgi:hypothetical protein
MHLEQIGFSCPQDCLLYLQGSHAALRVGLGAFGVMS